MGSSETDARKGWASAADGLGFLQLLLGDPPGQEGARPLWPTLRPGVTLLLPVSWPKQVRTPAQTQRRSYKIIHGKAVETREGKHLWPFLKKLTTGCYKKNYSNFKGHNFCTEDIYIPKMRYLFKHKYMTITLL